jgi:hypothetical protein
MRRHPAVCALALLSACLLLCQPDAHSQTPQTLSIPPDSPRWDLRGKTSIIEFLGRKCLMLEGGAAVLKEFESAMAFLRWTSQPRPRVDFFGFDFRIDKEGANYEEVYLRQHKSGLLDAMQYSPVLNTSPTGRCSTGPVSPERLMSHATSGFICASRSPARR